MINFKKMAHAFSMDGAPVSCICFGNGHINDTFLITTEKKNNYILQHINKTVFKNPAHVMENANNVTKYIRGNGGFALTFLETKDGLPYFCDERGEYWRAYEFLGGLCMDVAETAEDFYQSGLAFGQFQNQLLDYPAHTLHETIPNFHNTPDRFAQLHESIANDPLNRLYTCKHEMNFLLSHEHIGGELQNMLNKKLLPLRVTHNDTKLNNVLLDPETHKPMCVLDLDTVMPGLSAYDFGDAIRFGAATAVEDEPNANKMGLDINLFESFARGFLNGAPNLTENEKKVLTLGAFTITLELSTRFLKDYIDGDKYFKTAYPEHNLIRCRTQIAMCKDMLKKWDNMENIIDKLS